ncbi:MAG: tetratricopeptide repeat protein, partial [Candidatus Didemnitutus sp.]|nr:tetratricopeptide repeat protein [Candidatus Didemnitutus sp.]
GKNVPIPEIGEKLNVAYIVEGSVQRAGDRVKITAQLIKAADGFHVWSDTFTRDAKDVFAVQEEIAGRIAKELSLKLGVTSTSSSRAVDPRAFELYLLGRRAWNLRTVEGFDQAEKAFKEALAIEPDFARAHAALADVSLIRLSEKYSGRFDQRDSPELAKVTVMVERALALDPNLAEAHTSLGNLFWQSWRYEDAVRELRRAIALNPNYATAHQWLGRVLLAYGWIEEGEASLKRAAELDPLSHRILDNYSISLTLQQRDGEALAVLDRALALRPDSQQALAWKADTLSALGRHDEAVALVRRYPVADTVYAAGAVQILARAGLKKEANEALAHILAGGDSEVKFAGLVELGRMQEALDVLDPGAMGINGMGYYLFDPVFDPIRQNPRFVRMLATLGMTEAHARAQAWRAAHPPKKVEARK